MTNEAAPTNINGNNADTPTDLHTPTAATPTTTSAPAGMTELVSNASSTAQVRPGGAPARFYLNDKVVPYLLEGMKRIARDQPPNPLRVLGEYLIQKSNEFEGGNASSSTNPPE